MKIYALILAKSQSNRLPNKNIQDFHGDPMFVVNVKKCLEIFDKVYVSSDSKKILDIAKEAGAIPILRPYELCGETPNIPVYQHAIKEMDCDAFVAVQANSPTVKKGIIQEVKHLLERGWKEVMTMHADRSIYGSVWGLSKKKLLDYGDPYNPQPFILIKDISTDIHSKQDYENALRHN